MNNRLTSVGKSLTKQPRARPRGTGFDASARRLDAPVDDLLSTARRKGFPISYDELAECVETNDKRRYSSDETGDLIRVNRGHGVEVDFQLEERVCSEMLDHGTLECFLLPILAERLDEGRRHHVRPS